MHRRRRQPHDRTDTRRPKLATLPQRNDSPLELRRGPMRTPMRAARSVRKTRFALRLPASPPLVRGRSGHVHLLSDHRNRLTGRDPSNELRTSPQRQTSITVHKGLPSWRASSAVAHLLAEAPSTGGPCQQRGWSEQLATVREASGERIRVGSCNTMTSERDYLDEMQRFGLDDDIADRLLSGRAAP